jgi:hypothetical protein
MEGEQAAASEHTPHPPAARCVLSTTDAAKAPPGAPLLRQQARLPAAAGPGGGSEKLRAREEQAGARLPVCPSASARLQLLAGALKGRGQEESLMLLEGAALQQLEARPPRARRGAQLRQPRLGVTALRAAGRAEGRGAGPHGRVSGAATGAAQRGANARACCTLQGARPLHRCPQAFVSQHITPTHLVGASSEPRAARKAISVAPRSIALPPT